MLEAEKAETEESVARWAAVLQDAEDVFITMASRPLDEEGHAADEGGEPVPVAWYKQAVVPALPSLSVAMVISRAKIMQAFEGKDHPLFDNIEVHEAGEITREAWNAFFIDTKTALGRKGEGWLGALAYTLKNNLAKAMEEETRLLAEEETRATEAERKRTRRDEHWDRMYASRRFCLAEYTYPHFIFGTNRYDACAVTG